jgi:hypothetical protein
VSWWILIVDVTDELIGQHTADRAVIPAVDTNDEMDERMRTVSVAEQRSTVPFVG